jgi:hypothetical protein
VRVEGRHAARLGFELAHGGDITQQPVRIRPAVGYDVGTAARIEQFAFDLRNRLGIGRAFGRPVNDRAEQIAQQEIAGGLARWDSVGRIEHEMAFQAAAGRCCRRLAGVVGLGRPGGDDGIGFGGERLRDQVFEFAGFVAASSQPGLIVAFDV